MTDTRPVVEPSPGEWKADPNVTGQMTQVTAEGRTIALVYTAGFVSRGNKMEPVPDLEGEANLALVLASKKLLAAAKGMLAALAGPGDGFSRKDDAIFDAIDEATGPLQEAIAAAERAAPAVDPSLDQPADRNPRC